MRLNKEESLIYVLKQIPKASVKQIDKIQEILLG